MTHGHLGGNVVDLASHRHDSRIDSFVELETYWKAISAGRIMPYRDEVDPRGMEGILSRIFLIERIAAGAARFRVAGQHLTDLMGMDLRGMPFSCLLAPASRQRLADAVAALFDEPARIELGLDGGRSLLRGPVTGRMVCLPLRDRDGGVRRGIGCLEMEGSKGRAIQRLDVVEEHRRTLIGYGHAPASVSHAQGAAVARGTGHAGGAERTRHLQLVTGE